MHTILNQLKKGSVKENKFNLNCMKL